MTKFALAAAACAAALTTATAALAQAPMAQQPASQGPMAQQPMAPDSAPRPLTDRERAAEQRMIDQRYGGRDRIAPVVGQLGASYTRAGTEIGGANLDVDFIALEGALRFGSEHIGGSVDAGFTQSQLVPGKEENAFAGTLHVNGRTEDGLVGAFAGIDSSNNLAVWGAGVEGQVNLGDSLIVYGQVGFGQTKDFDIDTTDLWAARIDLRYYVTEDLKLQVSGGYQHSKDRFFKANAWIGGIEAEYMIPSTPFSVVTGYRRYEIDDLETISNIFHIGGRYTFGATTLHDRDRAGASLGTVNKLFNLDLLRN